MDKAYDHTKEEKIYERWEQNDAFSPKGTVPFTIIMPPPNANDPLHVGHAMFVAIEDILIRYHRMKGEAAEWLPGTDHAGIETQFVFEKKLAKEGKSRFDFDRETLYQKIWDYVQLNSGVAVNQMKRLGASADWQRYKFTLNPEITEFVTNTFLKLSEDKLVYREEKLINYCVKCGTGYSDLEIEYEERNDPLYFVKYPLVENEREFVTVATVRPEPIWADTHLAVNPKDKRNKHLIGKKVKNPLTDKSMEIIADEFVDPEFGTGVVKLTPAHDANDFAVAKAHNLPIIHAITLEGRIAAEGGELAGLKVKDARAKAVEILQSKGLIEKVNEKYMHRIATCYRCHTVIEPLPIPQFFIAVKSFTQRVLSALDEKKVVVHGTGREKILRDWLVNLRDWNVSRQIVWGIRMPVWYDTKTNPHLFIVFLNPKKEIIKGKISELLKQYSLEEIKKGLQTLRAPTGAKYQISLTSPADSYVQETDTFDTWFSSGQWPVVTLKTGQRGDFEKFYPTNVMETGYDILPIWVLRMLMLGIYLTDEVPFKDVYLHGLIRDSQGRKMSKSIGNVINPLDMVDKFGADAIRMALVMGSTPGQDKSVGEQNIRGMRNLSNKIWNATRFVKDFNADAKANEEYLSWLNTVIKETNNYLDKLRVGQASEYLYGEFWRVFCDVRIEEAKQGKINAEDLKSGLLVFLKLLHPFMPFVTEACYQELFSKKKTDLLILQAFPQS